jgi:ATP-binding cassette subfamily B protein
VLLVFRHALSVGSLVGYIGVLNLLGQACFRLMEALPEWLAVASGIMRVEEVLDERPHIVDSPGAVVLPGLSREIRFSRVSFGYGRDGRVLRDASAVIRAGQSVALVGRSGSGKSSVLSLLMRLYDPSGGTITIDGHDLRSVTQESLRAQFGVVFQDSFLFNRSVRENIRLGRPSATDAEVEDAARAAQVHEVILGLPRGYDTEVGERGGHLSGGQRQRIALARALVRDPAILVLDEATSALDPATEAAFVDTLRHLSRDRTVISVTHRLSSATDADSIIVLEGGRVCEQGTHEDLLRRAGVYHHLWDQQTGFVLSRDGRSARVTPQRLRQIPLFAPVDDTILAALAARFVSRACQPGEVIIRQGEVADTFFIVVRGSVEIAVSVADGQERRIDTREDGDFFGEIGLLRDVPRTATARALTPSLLLTLTREQFQDLLAMAPELRAVVEREAMDRIQRVDLSGAAGVD